MTELVPLVLPTGWSSPSEALLDKALAAALCKHAKTFNVLLAFVNSTIIKA